MRLLRWIFHLLRDVANALKHFGVSWLAAFSADGDGTPSWFWPSFQTGTVVGLVWLGFYYASDRAAYVLAVLVPFGSFCGITFVAWLTYRYKGYRRELEEKRMAAQPPPGSPTV